MDVFDHRKWTRCLRIGAVILLFVLAFLFWGSLIRDMISLIFGASVLAFILCPLAQLLEKHVPRSLAALISLLGVIALLILLVCLILPALINQLRSFSARLPEAFEQLGQLLNGFSERIQRRIPGFKLPVLDFPSTANSFRDTARSAVSTIRGAGNLLYRLFLTVMLSYFLLADRAHILLRMELMIPLKWRRDAVRAGNILTRQLRLYLRGQVSIAAAVGCIAAIGLILIGLDGAPLLGFLVGLMNTIPYFGPFLGGIPAVMSAVSISYTRAALTILILFLVQQIDGMLISPRIMGSITGFSPAIVMLALFAGARIGSIGGMLLAMPLLLGVRTLYRVFAQRQEND